MATRVLTAGLLLSAAGLCCAQDSTFAIKSTEVVPGLYMLDSVDAQFVGGNMGLIMGDDGLVLIDNGIAEVEAAYLQAVAELTGQPPDYLFNTHVHADHIGNNAVVAERGATVVAHENIRRRMLDGVDAVPNIERGLPTLTFQDGVTLHLNGFTIQAIHVANAHTDGDSILYFPDVNVIHTGDVLFNGMFPYIDMTNGGSVDGFLQALDRVLTLADGDTQIIAGHGPLASRDDVQRARDMLADAQSRVRRLVDGGMSEDDTVAANPLATYHDDWNWGFITTERMTRTLYQSLAR